jgi:hypothetical protein
LPAAKRITLANKSTRYLDRVAPKHKVRIVLLQQAKHDTPQLVRTAS